MVLKFVQSIHLILLERIIPISIAYPAIRPHPGRKIQVLTIHVHFAVLKTLGAQVEAGGGGSVGPQPVKKNRLDVFSGGFEPWYSFCNILR